MDDLCALQCAGAIATPAVQEWYSLFCGDHYNANLRPSAVIGRDLDFFSDKGSLFRLKVALASAALFTARPNQNCIIRNRDRSLGSKLIMDSGGFSLIDMQRLPDPSWVEICRRKQASWSDIAVAPDAPTRAASSGTNVDLDTFDKCLSWTRIWLTEYADSWQTYPAGRPVILNVLQGRTPEEWDRWLNQALEFQPQFDGFAFAGDLRSDWPFVISRLLRLTEQGWLDRCPWIHFLGKGNVSTAVILTAIRDGVRKATGNLTMEISFDDAQSSVSLNKGWTAPGLPLVGPNDARCVGVKYPDHPSYVGSALPFSPCNSPLAHRMTLGNICYVAGKRRTWDRQSECLLANHTIYVRAQALGQAAASSLLAVPEAIQQLPMHLVRLRHVIIAILQGGRGDLLEKWHQQLADPSRNLLPR